MRSKNRRQAAGALGEKKMKKRIFLSVLSLAVIFCGAAAGCSHTHTYGEWETVKEATCYEDGLRRRTCAEDGAEETEVIKAPGRHIYDVNNVCTNCGARIHPSENLHYEPLEDGTGYAVSLGACSDKNIVVPAYLLGRPVVAVQEQGFSELDGVETNGGKIESVWLPDGILTVGTRAFYGCGKLNQIVLPNTLVSIGENAFRDCLSLTKINAPTGLVTIGDSAFSGCSALVTPPLGEKLETVGQFAFRGCTRLETANFGGSLKAVGVNAFMDCTALRYATLGGTLSRVETCVFLNCTSLREISLGRELKSVGSTAFGNCSSLQTFRFAGTMAEWKAVTRANDWMAGNYGGEDLPVFYIYCTDGILNRYNIESLPPSQ